MGVVVTAMAVTAYYMVDEGKPAKKKSDSSAKKTVKQVAEPAETPEKSPASENDDEDESQYVIKDLVQHTPAQEDEQEMAQMAAQVQSQAMMEVLTPQQQQEFEARQMKLMQCTSEKQQMKVMQDLTEWVQKVMTKEQKDQIQGKLEEAIGQWRDAKAQKELQSAQSEITQHVLTEKQKGMMQKAQIKAEAYQKSGNIEKVMSVIQKVQEEIEESLSAKQYKKIKATLALRMAKIYDVWMEESVKADEQFLHQRELLKKLTPEQRTEMENMEKAVQQAPPQEQPAKMQRVAQYPQQTLSKEALAEVEQYCEEQKSQILQRRLQESKEKQLVIVTQEARTGVMDAVQKKKALALQTAVNTCQAKQDEAGMKAAMADLEVYMEQALNEEQSTQAQKEVVKAEAAIDRRMAEKSKSLGLSALNQQECKETVEKTLEELKEAIESGKDKASAVKASKEMLKMLKDLQTKCSALVEKGEGDSESASGDHVD